MGLMVIFTALADGNQWQNQKSQEAPTMKVVAQFNDRSRLQKI